MKLAILSDTHDHWPNFRKALTYLNQEKIGVVLHCGDICKRETLELAKGFFVGHVHWVRGNGDYGLEDVSATMEIELDGKKIFFNHYPDIARRAAESGKYDIAFYGHTHKPWAEQLGVCLLANPGELANQRFKPTFAIYNTNTGKLELKILEHL